MKARSMVSTRLEAPLRAEPGLDGPEHVADDPVRDAADRVQGRLADRLAKPPAEVAPLKRRSRRPGERADS